MKKLYYVYCCSSAQLLEVDTNRLWLITHMVSTVCLLLDIWLGSPGVTIIAIDNTHLQHHRRVACSMILVNI